MNGRLKRYITDFYCCVVHGERGAGKSTLFALVVEKAKKLGYDVYCQYPYKGCKVLPLIKYKLNGIDKYKVDKNFLYTANLTHSYILIDEAKTVWPARNYSDWTADDEDFFNMLRHNDIRVFLATQSYDMIDKNIRRAADYTLFLSPSFFNTTMIEMSRTVICKVADKNSSIVGMVGPKGAMKVVYDVCDVYITKFRFWRKPYYNKFFTTYVYDDKPIVDVPLWDESIDFPETRKEKRKFLLVWDDVIDKLNSKTYEVIDEFKEENIINQTVEDYEKSFIGGDDIG